MDEERLPGYVKVRYLYAPGEEEGGERRRATDPIWSLEIYDLSRSQVSKNQPVLYFLAPPAPRRSFVLEELQVVPEGTQKPDGSSSLIPSSKIVLLSSSLLSATLFTSSE